ncbi:MAG: hypothetical protein U9R75_00440, partial [Candidatus Thermoplasmatota archaeon]|nr:hypothetical protein [Candidatus Thermoplasmatota archaeon]
DGSGDMGIYLGFGIVGLIALMMVIGALYFLVFKKKKGKYHVSDEHLERFEKELEGSLSDKDEFAVAPAPKGLKAKTQENISAAPETGSLPPAQAEVPEEEAAPVTLAEEGSEDDWMNLVASETKAIEERSDVEEDKAVHSEVKSLQDLLSDMSSGIEDEEP